MITIFGASVTQQKNGYAKYLSNVFNNQVSIHGYGGMHLNNAAICFLNEIVRKNPDFCLIDWFSTGYIETNDETEECIEYLIFHLNEINCKPIFLFFPHEKDDLRLCFYQFCKNIIDKKGGEYIDLRMQIDQGELPEILKDDVHTTNYGSKLYASLIEKQLNMHRELTASSNQTVFTSSLQPKMISVEKTFYNRIELRGSCKIIGFLLTIGPHSGIVHVISNGNDFSENIEDKWCNFNRKHFNLAFLVVGEASIEIIQKIGSRKKSKLIVHEVYYSGESLIIENIGDGRRINFLSLKLENFISRIKKRFQILLSNCFC